MKVGACGASMNKGGAALNLAILKGEQGEAAGNL